MSNQERIRILSVDDHLLMREAIAILIDGEADVELVAQASNGREVIKCLHHFSAQM